MEKADPYGAIRNGEGKGISKIKLTLGAIVIRLKNGREARFVKVRMGGRSGSRWMQYARWWWEQHRGAVPAGKIVLHKDGDQMNDDPENFVLGTPGMKLKLKHERSERWSKWQHRRAALACSKKNRERGWANRRSNFLKTYWYPVVDEMGVIFNIPFRRRKRLLAAFGADITGYPKSGAGKHPNTNVQRAIRASGLKPIHSRDLMLRRYSTYCVINPITREFTGPIGASISQVIGQLDRMGVWTPAEQIAKTDLRDHRRG